MQATLPAWAEREVAERRSRLAIVRSARDDFMEMTSAQAGWGQPHGTRRAGHVVDDPATIRLRAGTVSPSHEYREQAVFPASRAKEYLMSIRRRGAHMALAIT